jgi:hypothetical protein
MYKMALKLTKGHEINQHFFVQALPKYIKIGIFGLPMYNLATLVGNAKE